MHFGITEKLTTDYIWLHNNAGLTSKFSEEIASENAENCRSRQPHCLLMPSPQRTFTNIRINLISPESRIIGLHFLPLIVSVYFRSNFCGALRKTHLFCNRVRIVKSSMVVDFGTNRKSICDFLLVINSNFGPILQRF